MNFQRKRSQVQLGRYSSSYLNKIQANLQSPSRPNPPLPSRQLIESAHRIPQTRSPTKLNQSRMSRSRQNNQSFTQLNSSKISSISKNQNTRILLADRLNKPSPQKHVISISYPNRSSSKSIESVKVQNYVQSPVLSQNNSRQVELQRKLKIVQNRVGQLHREKQQAVAQLNEENRKMYHQITTLKTKISDLNKIINRMETMRESTYTQKTQEVFPQAIQLSNVKMENQTLKDQIKQLEKYINIQAQKCISLDEQNSKLNLKVKELTQLHGRHASEVAALEQRINSQLNQFEHGQAKIIDLQLQLSSLQDKNTEVDTTQIDNLKLKLKEQQEKYQNTVQKYDSKIKQYENAYDQNQALIRQLQEQIRALQCQQVKQEEQNQESRLQEDLTAECLNLQGIFTNAIKERDEQIVKLKQQNKLNSQKIQRLESEKQELTICDEDKAEKLESASVLLQKMTNRFQELSQRYTELTQKYENEKSKMNKTQGFQARCKKCDDLLKTVLKLNSQLNPKK